MDPISIIGTVTGLITLVGSTVGAVRGYVQGVISSEDEAETLYLELESFKGVLLKLKSLLLSQPSVLVRFTETSLLVSSLGSCKIDLTRITRKLQRVAEHKRARLLWPLQRNECQDSIKNLRALTQWIQFALAIESCAILSQTADDVTRSLQLQLNSVNELQKVNANISSLDKSIADQSKELRHDRNKRSREDIIEWLGSYDPCNDHLTVKRQRMEGTSEWLISHDYFQSWQRGAINFLWCRGRQGSGKTVIASMIIDHLQGDAATSGYPVVYYYFDYKVSERQVIENVVSSLLGQLARSCPECIGWSLAHLHDRLSGSNRPSLDDLVETLKQTLDPFQEAFIVFDALDEYHIDHRAKLFEILEQLRALPNVHVLVTSRPFAEDIEEALSYVSSQIHVEANENDIRHFILAKIRASRRPSMITDEFAKELCETLIKGANGMFLLPALQLEAILQERTRGHMRNALSRMPDKLSGMYQNTIDRIMRQPQSMKGFGLHTLIWLAESYRPLQPLELCDILLVDMSDEEAMILDVDFRPSTEVIIESCQGLVVRRTVMQPLDSASSGKEELRFIHHTVQEHVRVNGSSMLDGSPQRFVAITVLQYLMNPALSGGPPWSDDPYQILSDVKHLLQKFPFYSYAASKWGWHVNLCQDDPEVKNMTVKFLASQAHVAYASQVARYNTKVRQRYWNPSEAWSNTGLHLACSFGLKNIVTDLMQSGEVDIDAATEVVGSTPLILAASRNQVEIVEMLLKAGADPLHSNWYGNALHCAAEAGCVETTKQLLREGVNVDVLSPQMRTPLECTLDRDQALAAEVLLDNGAAHSRSLNRPSFVQKAVVGSNPKILAMFLSRHFEGDINMKLRWNDKEATLLHCAAQGFPQIVRILIDAGADVNAKDAHGCPPLFYSRSTDVSELLLAAGANALEIEPAADDGEEIDIRVALAASEQQLKGDESKDIPDLEQLQDLDDIFLK